MSEVEIEHDEWDDAEVTIWRCPSCGVRGWSSVHVPSSHKAPNGTTCHAIVDQRAVFSGFPEYVVVYSHPQEGVRSVGLGWSTNLEGVRAHFEDLIGPARTEAETRADENEASGFEGGNEAWHSWHSESQGKKWRRYAIAEHYVTKGRVIRSEDGFEVPK